MSAVLPRPPVLPGPLEWLRANLFSNIPNALLTVVALYLMWKFVPPFVNWAFLDAIWQAPNTKPCQATGAGACWAFITEKHRFILFGTYPFEEHWRPGVSTLIFLALYAVSAMRRFWTPRLALVWLIGLTLISILMWGGVLGLRYVENERWGGLVLTLILATFGIAFAFPLSILLALGRRSEMPVVRSVCVVYIELIRGVPLISLLFMASVMMPLFLPTGVNFDKLLRAQIALILFAAAYLAEVVRGGLQAIPRGQYEAAEALGLSFAKRTALIILPQALKISIPPLVNTFIGLFKDTSLVVIIGLFDLLLTLKTALNEPAWNGAGAEAYLFAALVYFIFCYAMSQYSQMLERDLARGPTARALKDT